MASWIEDVVRALNNLGGRAALSQIYDEIERIRKEPLTATWQNTVRFYIMTNSSDSKAFRGEDLFRQVDKGVWALRVHVREVQLPRPQIEPKNIELKKPIPNDSLEDIASILRTIKQYRDYQDPTSSSSSDYVREIFHILGFYIEDLSPRLLRLCSIWSIHSSKAIVGLVRPGEDFQEIIPGLTWESHLMFAASYYQIEWGVLTNGLQLRILNFSSGEIQQPVYWPDFDGIIRNEKLDTFCTIHKVFSLIKGNNATPGEMRGKEPKKGDIGNEGDLANRHVLRLRFWGQLLAKAKTKTRLHSRVSPGNENWISTGAGKAGLGYNYVIQMKNAAIELYIDHGEPEWNKRAFGALYEHKAEIETAFGKPLDWQILSEKRASRIGYMVSDCGLNDEDRWYETQGQMIASMIRFEGALRPFIQQLG